MRATKIAVPRFSHAAFFFISLFLIYISLRQFLHFDLTDSLLIAGIAAFISICVLYGLLEEFKNAQGTRVFFNALTLNVLLFSCAVLSVVVFEMRPDWWYGKSYWYVFLATVIFLVLVLVFNYKNRGWKKEHITHVFLCFLILLLIEKYHPITHWSHPAAFSDIYPLFWFIFSFATADAALDTILYKSGRIVMTFVDPRSKWVDEKIDQKDEHPYRALDGHFARSKAEVKIDNFLTRMGVVHEYEPKIPNTVLFADFYLPEFDTYVEFWGRNDLKYRSMMETKLRKYKEQNLKLISIYPKDLRKLDEVFACLS